jgi:hypothetical protein
MGRFFAAFLTLGTVVAGCTTGEQSTAKQAQAADDQACQISGASPGTQAYSECRARLAQQRNNSPAQADENRLRDIDAKMQSGIAPTRPSPYGR